MVEYNAMSDFKGKPKSELDQKLMETREKLRAFRFAMTGGKQKNVKEGKMLRKDIARILTARAASKI